MNVDGNKPNVILVVIDSLNRHHLPSYNSESPVATPNLDRFAGKALRFDNHFVGSLPCIPARREIFAGKKEMMWRPWGPLEPSDPRLPRLLEESGYSTALVTDHYHYWEEAGNGYMQSFQGVETIRGHEVDFWKQPVPADEPVPEWVESIERWRPGPMSRQYYANVRDFESEEDFFPAKVFKGAARWLNENATKEPFFLQVESFDVHEPFHVPEPYASMYWDGGDTEGFTRWPPYQDPEMQARFMAQTTEAELEFIRSQYFGKLAMVDRWFGELLGALDRQALWENTVVIVTTDHGHDLGERGVFAKQYPHYDSHANIPMLVWHPGHPGNGRSVADLTSTVDLFATVLETTGVATPHPTHSSSLTPLISGQGAAPRDALLYGFFGQGVCATDGEWTIFKSPERKAPLFYYSEMIFKSLHIKTVSQPTGHGAFVPEAPLPQWQVPVDVEPLTRENFLFNRSEDPHQTENLWQQHTGQRRRMLDLLRVLLQSEGIPPEQYDRLGLDRS